MSSVPGFNQPIPSNLRPGWIPLRACAASERLEVIGLGELVTVYCHYLPDQKQTVKCLGVEACAECLGGQYGPSKLRGYFPAVERRSRRRVVVELTAGSLCHNIAWLHPGIDLRGLEMTLFRQPARDNGALWVQRGERLSAQTISQLPPAWDAAETVERVWSGTGKPKGGRR